MVVKFWKFKDDSVLTARCSDDPTLSSILDKNIEGKIGIKFNSLYR